ncbi:MAG TPA: HAMP domain-containing sensor histidine kinase [Acidobacteriaceae bacterium]|jgi:signal transduction histidine kinase
MNSGNDSITRRLILSVLGLELLAGVALIGAVAVDERHVQYKAFDANLRATSNEILGAVQEGVNDSVRLDLAGKTLPGSSVLRVTDEHGAVLGSEGQLPAISSKPNTFQHATIDGRSYRFFTLLGEKILDPGQAGGIHHKVTIVYGMPDGHVLHEVVEASELFALSTAVLLGITSLLLVWMVRRLLSPIHALANAASEISSSRWEFNPPASARRFVELRPLTLAIENTIGRLQRAFEQQKRFTNDAAHELKTDLAIVKSSFQLLSMKTRSVAEYEQGLAVGLDDLTRLERTTQKMLTLARLEQPESNGQVCRIDEVLRVAVQQSVSLADLRSNQIAMSLLPSATVPLNSDDAFLLCSNILLNALQHSPEQGTVEVSSTFQAGRVDLFIRDHGEGIDESDGPLLFEPFYRGDPSRSRRSGGTGLGLSICKAICDRIAGSISIANHAGGGAIVTVTLPASQVGEAGTVDDSPSPRASLSTVR